MKSKKSLLCILLAIVMVTSVFIPLSATESHFTDVHKDYWAFDAIEQAYSAGIVKGTSEVTFSPNASVTNAHFAAFLARAFYADEIKAAATDAAWYTPYTNVLATHGVTKGTTLASGFDTYIGAVINRYDMAQMMYNVLVDKKATMPDADLLSTTRTGIQGFYDMPKDYQAAVSTCYATGLLNGQTDGTFGGTNGMNRAQACVVVDRLSQHIVNGDTAPGTSADDQKPTEAGKPTEIEKPIETEKPTASTDIVNISLHFFLKDVRPMQHPVMSSSIVVA